MQRVAVEQYGFFNVILSCLGIEQQLTDDCRNALKLAFNLQEMKLQSLRQMVPL